MDGNEQDNNENKRGRSESDEASSNQGVSSAGETGLAKKKTRSIGNKAFKDAVQSQLTADRRTASGEKMARAMMARNDIVEIEVMNKIFSTTPANEEYAGYLLI
ncbi:hypothetical protein Pcac1_g26046 [Phytophthora cactorum]|nr:hypothetical protein Pcac1_g26046 [Phytophthora cactorum]